MAYCINMSKTKKIQNLGYLTTEVLGVRFPTLTFEERRESFCEKVTRVLDLMEITHLYVKITTPGLYVRQNHDAVVQTKKFIVSSMEEMMMPEFEELRHHLKHSILLGNN